MGKRLVLVVLFISLILITTILLAVKQTLCFNGMGVILPGASRIWTALLSLAEVHALPLNKPLACCGRTWFSKVSAEQHNAGVQHIRKPSQASSHHSKDVVTEAKSP
jgi:hypothetical protein